MGLSIRAYARHRGVSHVAVKKAIDTGPHHAGGRWHDRSDAGRSGVGTEHRGAAQAGTPAQSRCIGSARPVASETPAEPADADAVRPAAPRCCRRARSTRWSRRRPTRCAWPDSRAIWSIARRPSPTCFRLARTERDAWLNWPARISAQMAAKLEVDAHALHVALEAAVREHLQELGELRPRVD